MRETDSTARRAVVHIGIDKTGTTTIQRTLFQARLKLLSEARVLYPSIAANQSVYLGTLFRDKAPPLLQLFEPDATDERSIARFREEFRASLEADMADPNWHTLVISAESLCGFPPKAIARFTEWLTGYVEDISVVAYVRHPVDWTRSVMQQRLKLGETFDQLYDNMLRPNWRNRFTPWLNAVGHERFRLVSFDEARENDGIMAAFCDAAGLSRETILSLAPIRSANESMSLEAALLLDSLNRQRPLFVDGKLSPKRRWRGTNVIRAVPGNRFYLNSELAAKARADNRPDLEWLNETFGKDLYPDVFEDTPLEAPANLNTMPRATVDALAIILSDLGNKQAAMRAEKLAQSDGKKEVRTPRNAQTPRDRLERAKTRVKNLESRNRRLARRLREIENSRIWRLLGLYRRMRQKLGSSRKPPA